MNIKHREFLVGYLSFKIINYLNIIDLTILNIKLNKKFFLLFSLLWKVKNLFIFEQSIFLFIFLHYFQVLILQAILCRISCTLLIARFVKLPITSIRIICWAKVDSGQFIKANGNKFLLPLSD